MWSPLTGLNSKVGLLVRSLASKYLIRMKVTDSNKHFTYDGEKLKTWPGRACAV